MLPLSVITVTHNHEAYIQRTLETVIPQVESLGGEIIVIDNCSDDNSVEIVNKYPQVKLHINSKRQGFSMNNNQGMAFAEGRYILLLNPDTEVLPNSLERLLSFMDNHLQVGLCGAQLLFPDGRIQPSARRFPSVGTAIVRRTPLRVFLSQSRFNQHHLMSDLDPSKIQSVDWLLGACLFIRREILETVGPLDEGFFLYVEDIDWAKRIHLANWDVCYVPTAQVIHHHLAVSDKKWLSYYTWLHMKSMVRYIRKYWLFSIPYVSIRNNQFDVWNHLRQGKN
jgi:N-acetylglucosaminyl-diphospho-decaprenol L-rhamnosyltransferase